MKMKAEDAGLRMFLLVIMLLLSACSEDSDPRHVDFGKTVPVVRPGESSANHPILRVAVGAMVSPKETFIYYRQLLDYLAGKLGRKVELVQRKTYEEVNELIGQGKIDLAFICSGPYVSGKDRYSLDLIATPEVQGSHFYQSYLIVSRDSPFKELEDLRGRVFAFTDPDSLTGKLVPTHWLTEIGERPDSFFSKTIYTYSHDNSMLAVARGLVDGAAVDGLIWEYYHRRNPSLSNATRVIRRSEPYAIPPVVSSGSLSLETKEQIRGLLFAMHEDPRGRSILDELMIDRFVEPMDGWYDSIRRLEQTVYTP
jgi:phosphonate transport system substrate-binding protein